MSLIACGSIQEGHEWFSDDSQGRQEIFMCLAVLLCEQFCRFANEGAKISIKSYFLSVFSSSECLPKLLPFGVNCRLQLAGLGKKKRGNWEANLLYVQTDYGTTWYHRHHRQIIHSVLHPFEALNLIIESKSQPRRKAKEKLAIILFCGF